MSAIRMPEMSGTCLKHQYRFCRRLYRCSYNVGIYWHIYRRLEKCHKLLAFYAMYASGYALTFTGALYKRCYTCIQIFPALILKRRRVCIFFFCIFFFLFFATCDLCIKFQSFPNQNFHKIIHGIKEMRAPLFNIKR